ncbi:MAG: hypothetical protein R6W84_14915 [Promethearchaeia archaeon]
MGFKLSSKSDDNCCSASSMDLISFYLGLFWGVYQEQVFALTKWRVSYI